jgi:hypothetical protein
MRRLQTERPFHLPVLQLDSAKPVPPFRRST